MTLEDGALDPDVGLEPPASGSPDGGAAAGAIPAGNQDDLVTLRIKDEEYRLPSDEVQAFADRLGWDKDELVEALQIGRDGRNVYRTIASEKDRLRQAWEDINALRANAAPEPAPAPARAASPGGGLSRPRPPAEDITGQLLWTADVMERMLPVLERLPTIEEVVNRTASTAEERERLIEVQTERSAAATAYNEVSANWKREGYELPPQHVLEQKLRQFPISDDIDMSWSEIWDQVAWMVAGPRIARQARRKAVLDGHTPRTAAPIAPAHRGFGGGAPAAPAPGQGEGPKSLEQLEAEGKALERQLSGVTVADVAPALSRR